MFSELFAYLRIFFGNKAGKDIHANTFLHSFRILARFEYDRRKGKSDKRKRILFSDYFDFDEENFKNIMVHEMIHYYLLMNGTNDKCDHGADFMAMAQELNQKYGLNITTTFDASNIPNTPHAPKRTWWRCLFCWFYRI